MSPSNLPLVAAIALGLGLVALGMAWKAGAGLATRSRLARVGAVGLLAALPALTWLVVSLLRPEVEVTRGAGLLVVALSGVLLLSSVVPLRLLGGAHPTDETTLRRAQELAVRVGAAPPAVIVAPSCSSSLATSAAVGGLMRPVVLVTDGIVHRLLPDERDAILAHELAHDATRSLWTLVTVQLLGLSLALVLSVLSGATDSLVVIAFTPALAFGLKGLFQRGIETRCDVLGARATSHAAMARALTKLHAIMQPVRSGLLLWRLHDALGSHPPLLLREWALRQDALARGIAWDESVPAADDTAARALQRLNRLVQGAWVALLLGAMALLLWLPSAWWVACLAVAVLGLLPALAPLLAGRRAARVLTARHSMPAPGTLLRGLGLLLSLGSVFIGLAVTALVSDPPPTRILLVVYSVATGATMLGLALFVAGVIIDRESRSLAGRAALFPPESELEGLSALLSSHPRSFARDATLQVRLARCLARAGRDDEAFALLEDAGKRFRKLAFPHLAAAELAQETAPALALEAAGRAALVLPRDPLPEVLRGQALRQLGRQVEAGAAASRALALAPGHGQALALAAVLALDEGHQDAAESLVQRAEERAPGHPDVVLAAAEAALASGDAARAAAAFAEAARIISGVPLAFRSGTLDQLGRRFTPPPLTSTAQGGPPR